MQVILLERVEKLGQIGELVTVKPGYARNFLFPKKKALRANKENIAYFETQKVQLEAANLERASEAQKIAKKLEGVSIVLVRQASEAGHLYGSVVAKDVAIGLTEAGYTVHKSQVKLDKPLKELGVHTVQIALHPEVKVSIHVNIAKSEDEAIAQANFFEQEVNLENTEERAEAPI